MKLRLPNTRSLRPTAIALSVLVALTACSSNDDDDNGDMTGDDVAVTAEVTLSPDQEIPPVSAEGASGTGSLTVNGDGSEISGSVTLTGLSGTASMAHIHRGFAGANGPVVVGLVGNADGTVWSVADTPEFTNGATAESFAEAFARGELYFNAHTADNGGGEVRGQILPATTGLTTFTVRIENVSTPTTLPTSTDAQPVPLSPGAFVVHRGDATPLFEDGAPANGPLEMVAEDGIPDGYAATDNADFVPGSVVFNTPAGADEAGAIGPGAAYELTFSAVPGDKLSLVTMFVPSNDWFYTMSGDDNSLSLFDEDGAPISGAQAAGTLEIYDAGTEQDETPGEGPNQVERQSDVNTGPAEGANVGSLVDLGKSVELNGPVVSLVVTPAVN